MYYVFLLTPNQTPSRDMYFLEKLLNLKGDDGFEMNKVLVSLWYIMGLWPLVYSMLLLPSGRSSESKIPVWPFLVLSFFGGAYALLPYFILWKPPPPSVDEAELGRWPLNFLESKLTAGILTAAGLGLITYAGLADADVWKEFYQYFRESKFIHVTCLDFTLLSTFAPFWVYNDITARKWSDKGSWILPLTLIPLLGPAFYLVLRPSLSASSTITEAANED
ncbi:transmembrane protein [Thalictrum thalictroides]|uniref:Transmembrane protein n=1 Tax=Thalictrum thalictroides TaxID=46969 RepID=A0A7J6X9H2_THATH|nr:transmembrane protein [Thalictrum thalictroides]